MMWSEFAEVPSKPAVALPCEDVVTAFYYHGAPLSAIVRF